MRPTATRAWPTRPRTPGSKSSPPAWPRCSRPTSARAPRRLAIVDNTPPAIAGFEYTSPGGVAGSGYEITFTPDPGPGANTGNPLAFPNTDITTGPFEGFKGLITPYTLTVTARSDDR